MLNYINSIDFTSIRRLNLNDKGQLYETLYFTDFNIFIGPNGSGKSTILDILHCFSNQEKISTLMRENNPSTAKSKIIIKFNSNNDDCLKIVFHNTTINPIKGEENSIEYHDASFKINERGINHYVTIQLKKTNRKFNIEKLNKLFKSFDGFIKVNYLDINYINVPVEEFVKILNEISFFLNGIGKQKTKNELKKINNYEIIDINADMNEENKFVKVNQENNNLLYIYLNDDLKMYNIIPRDLLPSGWISIIKIIYFLKEAEDYSICLIEEPENHLHPKLQRILITKIQEYIKTKHLQVFITTHSPIFINIIDNNLNISLFEATTDSIIKLKNQNNLLNELGTKASDILQTNGIIWVEGPSDRIYIKYWLEMWCKLNNKVCPIENIHYSFSMYGGSIINHFSLKENDFDDLIDLLKLNRNAIIVIDNDSHFNKNQNNEYVLVDKRGENKNRIIEEMKSCNNQNLHIWITEGYTIESYLNENFISLYFDLEINHKIKLKDGKNKVQIAKNYIEKGKFKNKYDLFEQIEIVYNTLLRWN